MPVYIDGKEYSNDAEVEAHFNPDIPASLASAFRMPLEGSTEPAGAFKSQPGTPVAPEILTSPEPSQEVDWSKLNQPFGDIKSTSKEDIPVVATAAGGITITEGDIGEAINVGMGAGPGTMAGVRSKTISDAALNLAVTAERQGFSADDIYKGTGFFKGADNSWRYEIDDSAAKFFPENLKGGQKLLSDVLSHKELFEAYPELRNIKVREDAHLGGGAQYGQGVIAIGPKALKDKSILMHEVQHAIQDIEGFAKGGMPGRDTRDFKLLYEADVTKLRPEILNLNAKKRRGDSLTPKEEARLDYLNTVFDKYNEYFKAGQRQAYENYLALSGEVEARNVQSRIDLTPQERMRFNPLDTEDVARSKQLTRKEPSLTTPYVVRHPYDRQPDFHTY